MTSKTIKTGASEFRARQNQYLEMVEKGDTLIIHSRRYGYFKIEKTTSREYHTDEEPEKKIETPHLQRNINPEETEILVG